MNFTKNRENIREEIALTNFTRPREVELTIASAMKKRLKGEQREKCFNEREEGDHQLSPRDERSGRDMAGFGGEIYLTRERGRESGEG